MKTWYKLISFSLFLFCLFIISPTPISAVDCSNVPISGNYSVNTACAFAGTINGVDTGTSSTNTAVLTIATGGSLSILSGQTITVGSISLTGGSIIQIQGTIKIGTPLWMVDADADGYPANTTQYAQTSAPGNGRRRNTMTSITETDCNDLSYNATNQCCVASGNYFGDGSDGNVTISSNTSIANTADGDYVVKEYNTLTINSGVTLTTQNRAKGLFIYVKGNAIINGTISMTARGANANPTTAGVSATGLRLPMVRSGSTETLSAAGFAGAGSAIIAAVANQGAISGDGKIYIISKEGGAGAVTESQSAGGTGGTGTNMAGGGGSGGGKRIQDGGHGGIGSCFGGGSGGGSGCYTAGGNGVAYGGAGGRGWWNADPEDYANGGGGAGNPGGLSSDGGFQYHCQNGGTGTGGVIWLVVGGNLTIGSGGVIEAKGVYGGFGDWRNGGGGGGSGGGIVKILYGGTLNNTGTISVAGGIGGSAEGTTFPGGAGGAGKSVIEQVALYEICQ